MTVVLSSHLLAEVEQLCDRVAILNQGQLIFQGHWSELIATAPAGHRLELDDWTKAGIVLQQFGATRLSADTIALAAQGDMADLVAALVHAGVRVRGVEPVRRNLEEIYLNAISGVSRS